MGRKTKQNKITSPELIAQINPKNIRLMNDFLDYLRSVGKAESTVKAYTSDLHIFFVWVLQNADNKYFPEISKRDIVAYQNWLLRSNENSPARVRRLKATLSSLSNYIEAIMDDELPNFRSIVRKIENPINEPTREKTVLTDEQADMLLNYLTERGQHEKACCFALARYSGRRKSELVRFMDKARFKELFSEMRKDLQDNDSGAYSKTAREWALATGLIAGNGTQINGEPNCMWQDFLTREQLVTVLYRFAQIMGKA